MPHVLLQPRGSARVHGGRHFEESIRRGIRIDGLRGLTDEQRRTLEGLYPSGRAQLWGSTPTDEVGNRKASALQDRRVGDLMLFYAEKAFIAQGRIAAIFRNPRAAEEIWGATEDGQTWEHMVALNDVVHFRQPIPSARILAPLGMHPVVRGLTLLSESDSARVLAQLPGGSSGSSSNALEPSVAKPAERASLVASADEFLDRLSNLHVAHRSDVAATHQPLALLWTLGRVSAGKPRLSDWPTFRTGVGTLQSKFGGTTPQVTPEDPFWHLRGSGLWEVIAFDAPGDFTVHGASFDNSSARAGLLPRYHRLLQESSDVIASAVGVLRSLYLSDIPTDELLTAVGLSGYGHASGVEDGEGQDNERRITTVERVVRSTAVATAVKRLHQDTCQFCGLRLETASGYYSEAAHVRGLGRPHNGPDRADNVLCLCPNHHVQFDLLAVFVDPHLIVRRVEDLAMIGHLRTVSGHVMSEQHLAYHRRLCGVR